MTISSQTLENPEGRRKAALLPHPKGWNGLLDRSSPLGFSPSGRRAGLLGLLSVFFELSEVS